jgi:hypothetical protein
MEAFDPSKIPFADLSIGLTADPAIALAVDFPAAPVRQSAGLLIALSACSSIAPFVDLAFAPVAAENRCSGIRSDQKLG